MKPKSDFSDKHKQLARIAKALSHPARIYIVERLSQMDGCCSTSGEMIGQIPIARSTLSQHLKELKYAGIIQGEIEPPKIKYCLNKQNWEMIKELFKEFLKLQQYEKA